MWICFAFVRTQEGWPLPSLSCSPASSDIRGEGDIECQHRGEKNTHITEVINKTRLTFLKGRTSSLTDLSASHGCFFSIWAYCVCVSWWVNRTSTSLYFLVINIACEHSPTLNLFTGFRFSHPHGSVLWLCRIIKTGCFVPGCTSVTLLIRQMRAECQIFAMSIKQPQWPRWLHCIYMPMAPHPPLLLHDFYLQFENTTRRSLTDWW